MNVCNYQRKLKKHCKQYAIINHEELGKIYAYEVNGFGSFNLMDDANVPSLVIITLFKCR